MAQQYLYSFLMRPVYESDIYVFQPYCWRHWDLKAFPQSIPNTFSIIGDNGEPTVKPSSFWHMSDSSWKNFCTKNVNISIELSIAMLGCSPKERSDSTRFQTTQSLVRRNSHHIQVYHPIAMDGQHSFISFLRNGITNN